MLKSPGFKVNNDNALLRNKGSNLKTLHSVAKVLLPIQSKAAYNKKKLRWRI